MLPVRQVALDVSAHWPRVSPPAESHVMNAMRALDNLAYWHGLDSAVILAVYVVSLVLWFLASATARRVSAALRAR